MRVYLETDRLILREFTEEDVDDLYTMNNDPEVMRYIPTEERCSREEIASDYIPAYLDYYRNGDGYGFWVAIEKASGNFLGWFHLRPNPGDPSDEPELGYRLVTSAWGKGYGTEGSIALIDKAFSEFGANRVVANTMTVNTGSRRVMEKSGLKFIRTYFLEWPEYIEGAEHGDVEYALTRDEWASARAS